MIPIAQPLLGDEERAAVLSVMESGQLAQGEQVAAFERRFAALCQVREAVAVSSGTAALHLALLAHGIGGGDEVISTPCRGGAWWGVNVCWRGVEGGGCRQGALPETEFQG